jgi:hypothetical protein
VNQEPIAGAADYLREDRRLLDVFYHFTDNKESLKERAKGVYLNGLLWSTMADAMAAALFLAFTSIVVYLLFWRDYYLVAAIVALALYALAAWALMPLVVRRHIELGNEQINFMRTLYESELRSQLENLARGDMRRNNIV